jgi:hypothetical protein
LQADLAAEEAEAALAANPPVAPFPGDVDYYGNDGYPVSEQSEASDGEPPVPAAVGGGDASVSGDEVPPGVGGEASWPASEDEQEEPAVAPAFGGANGGQIVPAASDVSEEEEQDDFEEVFAALDALVEPSVDSTSGTSEKESEGSSSSADFDSDPGNPYWAGFSSRDGRDDSDESDRSGLDRSLSWS